MRIDLTGHRYSRWVVLHESEANGRSRRWRCVCDCGTERDVYQDHLRSGASQSCGCFRSEVTADRATKHGSAGTPEYGAWRNMIDRCRNPNNKHYADYGGRGIAVHPEWCSDFVAFFVYMGKRPSAKHSIDRIYNEGNYEPGNVRWATREQQAQNTRLQQREDVGVDNHRGKWRAQIYANGKRHHLGIFATKIEAIAARRKGEAVYFTDTSVVAQEVADTANRRLQMLSEDEGT